MRREERRLMTLTGEFSTQGFPSGLLNEGLRDSLCGVKRSLIMIQTFFVLKSLKLLPKY